MATPQQAKTPKLNALLIGKRTVPSGCRVLNVSQQGMSLQCDPDGRLLTFSSGDAVDIYLSVQHSNGHNKFTIPAIVSHVDENLIDVVFHCTDTELAGLIESYRTSESHDLEATIDYRLVSKSGIKSKPVGVNEALSERNLADTTPASSKPSFYFWLLTLFVTSLVLLGAYYYATSINNRISSLESISRKHTEELADVQSQVFSSRLQDGRYASLNARMKALTDAFQSFEKRVSTALLQPTTSEAVTEPAAPESTATDRPRLEESVELQPAIKPTATESRPRTIPAPIPAPKAAPAPAPRTATVSGQRPASASDASKPSQQKYPVIDAEPPAVKPSSPATATSSVSDKTPVEKKSRQDIPATVTNKDTGSSKPEPVNAVESGKPVLDNKVSSTEDTQQTITQTPKSTPRPSTRTEKAASTTAQNGPWVINILSSPSKSYVEKMHATATSAGIDTIITSAEVKGKQYWRLQIPGFKSMSAAKSAAEPVKDNLKINDVWIFKRKR